ncbi:peptide chain release factor N(5)-glutamine methyltransferase [Neorhizobium galegae]|uniref:peptide chain release factor N(5)-glutamine methyltransferase n=1 Tax=Neorhizobium galegae TaxID=399 RepID=UPI0006220E65|nr:peptide chain release factor N(5)-glutamine methyltransferase [Neorhizobium galegae]KAB1123536.1 peptide chain release factor N(5)-glutamine methyltransferase [Neorhizobium galegae]MCQ1806895.1 peptide chain release factor N(5)-glutamine methyltransferase [Neorhizobium galegae]CDZ60014.1 Release factor glutamine methyltransferase [Neorhizobium galegae bv. orientalis]
MTILSAAVADARSRFSAAGLPDAAIEARLLIGGLLGLSSTEVFTGGDRLLTEEETSRISKAVARRLKREPVHRILGSREFHGMELLISKETLEPRPDTEILVDSMLAHVRQIVAVKGSARILDLGAGTGAIVLALLKESPEAQGIGSDISEDALQTAARNAARLEMSERFQAIRSDWFDAISGRFDIIVSNPPYIRSDVIPALDPEVRDFDPLTALDGGPDGLEAYRAIAAGAGDFLEKDGVIGVEIGFDQKETVTAIFRVAGFTLAEAVRDYGDNDRVLVFTVNHP